MTQGDSKRSYAKHVKELVESDAKTLQFRFAVDREAMFCYRNVRDCIERNDYDLTCWRVKTVVYVEKI